MKQIENLEEKILSFIRISGGTTTKDVAKNLNIGIATASKYLEVLKTKEMIHFKKIGPSNYWALKKPSQIDLDFNKFKKELKMTEKGELIFNKEFGSSVIFSWKAVVILITQLIKMIGYDKTKKLIYSISKERWKEFYKAIKSITDLKDLSLLKSILNFSRLLGYGKFEIRKYDLITGEGLFIYYSPVSAYKFKKQKKPICFPISGMLSAFISEDSGLNVECEETKCIVKGDPYCEFVTKPILIKKEKMI